jgi:hypothetical protein
LTQIFQDVGSALLEQILSPFAFGNRADRRDDGEVLGLLEKGLGCTLA